VAFIFEFASYGFMGHDFYMGWLDDTSIGMI
jgi:hypothetical protein